LLGHLPNIAFTRAIPATRIRAAMPFMNPMPNECLAEGNIAVSVIRSRNAKRARPAVKSRILPMRCNLWRRREGSLGMRQCFSGECSRGQLEISIFSRGMDWLRAGARLRCCANSPFWTRFTPWQQSKCPLLRIRSTRAGLEVDSSEVVERLETSHSSSHFHPPRNSALIPEGGSFPHFHSLIKACGKWKLNRWGIEACGNWRKVRS
jgi:hypothetical protein